MLPRASWFAPEISNTEWEQGLPLSHSTLSLLAQARSSQLEVLAKVTTTPGLGCGIMRTANIMLHGCVSALSNKVC